MTKSKKKELAHKVAAALVLLESAGADVDRELAYAKPAIWVVRVADDLGLALDYLRDIQSKLME